MQNEKEEAVYTDAKPQLIVRRFNPAFPNDAPENTLGMVFEVDDNNKLSPTIAEDLIVSVKAAMLPDGRTTVVTALLRNDFIISESISFTSAEENNVDLAVKILMPRIKARIDECLSFMVCCGTVTVNKLIEFEKIREAEYNPPPTPQQEPKDTLN